MAFACIRVGAYGKPWLFKKKNRIRVCSFNLHTKRKQWSRALAILLNAVLSAALKRYQDDNRMLFKNNLHETYVTFLGKTNVNQPHTHIFFTYKNRVYIQLTYVGNNNILKYIIIVMITYFGC